MTFSYHVMFIHNVFISKRSILSAVGMAAVYQLKIKYDQDKFGAVFLDAFDTIHFSRQRLIEKIRKVTSRFNNTDDDQDLNLLC